MKKQQGLIAPIGRLPQIIGLTLPKKRSPQHCSFTPFRQPCHEYIADLDEFNMRVEPNESTNNVEGGVENVGCVRL